MMRPEEFEEVLCLPDAQLKRFQEDTRRNSSNFSDEDSAMRMKEFIADSSSRRCARKNKMCMCAVADDINVDLTVYGVPSAQRHIVIHQIKYFKP